MPEKECIGKRAVVFNTYALTVCALLTALSVILARLLTIIPSEISRFSLEAVPILLAGLLFGPVPGAAVGFAADFIGCLFSPFGYNPIFCLPPILYGLWAGLLRGYAWTKPTVWRVALAVFPAALCGSVLWQSAALALVYGGVDEVRAGPRRRGQAGLLSHPPGLPQHPVRRHRRHRHRRGMAAAP